jgi:hypothetical protein
VDESGFLTYARFQIAAPGGFSAHRPVPASTFSGFAARSNGLTRSHLCLLISILTNYATEEQGGQGSIFQYIMILLSFVEAVFEIDNLSFDSCFFDGLYFFNQRKTHQAIDIDVG